MTTFDALRRDTTLSPQAFRVAEYLHRFTRRCYDESFTAAVTISRFLDVSVRTVQRALRALALAGYVRIVRDRTLRTGRRILMAWRTAQDLPFMRPVVTVPTAAPNASENDHIDVAPTTSVSSTPGVPPDPPIEGSEDKRGEGDVDPPRGGIGAGDPAFGHPAPAEGPVVVVSRSLTPEPEEEATPPIPEPAVAVAEPEPIPAEVIAQAEAVFGAGPGTVGRVRALARQYTPGWVARALGIAERKARTEPVGTGYLVGTLRRFAAEGGPPEEQKPHRAEEDTLEAQKARLRARYAARGGGG